jgi:hypothetical protein
MKNALGILLVIAIVIIFVQNLCRKPLPPNPASKAAYEDLKKRFDDTTHYLAQALKEERERRESDSIARKDLQERFDKKDNALNASQVVIHRLAAKIEGAKLEKPDSTWVKVSPHYVDGCDSLKDRALAQQETIDQQQEDGAKFTEHMMGEIAWRDSAIEAKNAFNRKFSNQLEDCMTQLHAKVNAKQRNQVYAGIGIFGNKINPLAGGQVNVSLRTRNSQIYEITGATVGNTWYAGVGTKMLITFKR